MAGSNGNGTNGHHDEPAPQGLDKPPIDHEKVAEAANQDGTPYSTEQATALKDWFKSMEGIRDERSTLKERETEAEGRLRQHCPNINMKALKLAWALYLAAEEEQSAGAEMEKLAGEINDLSTVFAHPRLF